MKHETDVLVVGAGAVGMTLALDLAWRGIETFVVDERDRPVEYPRCNNVAARSMEHYHRLGIADTIRRAGMPDDHPTDTVYRTRYLGHEYCRFSAPPARDVLSGAWRSDKWPTAEPNHKINQTFFNPILESTLRARDKATLRRGVKCTGYEQQSDHVAARLEDVASGDAYRIKAKYLVGCDGGSSMTRRHMGASMTGIGVVTEFHSFFIRSRDLAQSAPDRVWMCWVINPDGRYTIIAVNGIDTFLVHKQLPLDGPAPAVDARQVMRGAAGRDIEFDLLAETRWTARRLVAEKYRDRRVFLAGDSAHLWIPYAGFGMNAGIGDACELSWRLAGVLDGWGGEGLLDSYQEERQGIGEQVATAVVELLKRQHDASQISERIEDDTPEGESERRRIGARLTESEGPQCDCVGLNFGTAFPDSSLVWPDGTRPPRFEVGTYEPSATPGCRLPHRNDGQGRSLYDLLGPGYSLLEFGDAIAGAEQLALEASARGVPLRRILLDPELSRDYGARAVLVRPDQYVVWRGHSVPDANILLDRVTGQVR